MEFVVTYSNFKSTVMNANACCSKDEQIKRPNERYGHLVILGAGASIASCLDNPEKFGKSLPSMKDLPEIVGLEPFLKDIPEEKKRQNFEKLFSELYLNEGDSERIRNMEEKMREYFSSLQLPDTPTIYDYMVLSLRSKDLIATFNWDPFLVQAYLRNSRFTRNLPGLVFLHGNVAVGYDTDTQKFGQIIKKARYNHSFKPTKLLYPIAKKDYNSDPFIKGQWDTLLNYLDSAALITIFGYSAPKTDAEAKKFMKKVWKKKDRYMPQIEIINIDHEENVNTTWRYFLNSQHFSHVKSLFDEHSWLYNFPRRTGEMFEMKYIEGRFQDENRPPKFDSLDEMREWYSELIRYDSIRLAEPLPMRTAPAGS